VQEVFSCFVLDVDLRKVEALNKIADSRNGCLTVLRAENLRDIRGEVDNFSKKMITCFYAVGCLL